MYVFIVWGGDVEEAEAIETEEGTRRISRRRETRRRNRINERGRRRGWWLRGWQRRNRRCKPRSKCCRNISLHQPYSVVTLPQVIMFSK